MKSSYNLSELINSSLLSEYNDILNDTEEFDRLFSNDTGVTCDCEKLANEYMIPINSGESCNGTNSLKSETIFEKIILEKTNNVINDIINEKIFEPEIIKNETKFDKSVTGFVEISSDVETDNSSQSSGVFRKLQTPPEIMRKLPISGEIEINGLEARAALKKKLEDKRNSIKNKKQPLITKEDNQINMLKNNPLFKNIENADKESIKKIIDTVASSMKNDSKQKKIIKKQVEKLIDKMIEKKI